MGWSQGLIHVRQVVHHWAETPAKFLNFYFEIGFKLLSQVLNLMIEFKIIFLHSPITSFPFSEWIIIAPYLKLTQSGKSQNVDTEAGILNVEYRV